MKAITESMKDLIGELRAEGIHILPLKYSAGKFVHPDRYADDLINGMPQERIDTLLAAGFNNAIAVMHGPCNPHVMCMDFDEKNAPGASLYETWRHLVDDDIFRKLVIERTRSAGYHVYFSCPTLPPMKALASSPTGEEWIAIRSAASNGITYCAPSPGYTELQGSLMDIQEISTQDMFSLCSAAAELDRYSGFRTAKTAMLPVVRIPQKIAPLVAEFDKSIDDQFIPNYLIQHGWSTDGIVKQKMVNGEKWQYMRMWRRGRDISEPYSANYWINRKRLSVFSQSTPFPAFDSGKSFSHPPSSVIMYMCNGEWSAAVNEIIEIAKTSTTVRLPEATPMLYSEFRGKSEVLMVEIKGIIEWAVRSGYQWMRLSAEEGSDTQLIRVVDNIIYEVDDKDITREYLSEVDKNYQDAASNRILTRFMPQIIKYMDALPIFDQRIITDEPDSAYIHFQNGALRITPKDTKLIKYPDLDGCVFSKYIKPFDYQPAGSFGTFGEFIDKICIDVDHKRFMMSVLGYIMHHYKLRNLAKAVMIIEDVEDQEEARGRSGKGLVAQFIEWVRWSVQQDGRNFKNDSQFKMQRITPGVQVYYLNDPAPGLLMNQFYNFITDDWTVEAKGKKSYVIKFRDSPKILITTNYLPPLESDSDKDRFVVLPIKKHFGASHTIRNEFPGVIFFDENWNHHDRNGAVNFAIECIKIYLKESILTYQNKQFEDNAAARVIKNSVPDAIIEVVDQGVEAATMSKNQAEFEQAIHVHDLRKDQQDSLPRVFMWSPGRLSINTSAMYQYCLKAYSLSKITDKVFGKKLKLYAKMKKYEVLEEVRNNTTGRRITLKISAINFPEGHEFDGTGDKISKWEPPDGFEPF